MREPEDAPVATRPTGRRIRLHRRVSSEPILLLAGVGASAKPGEYEALTNPYGAIAVQLEGGELFGLKPGEFEWIDRPLSPRDLDRLFPDRGFGVLRHGGGRRGWRVVFWSRDREEAHDRLLLESARMRRGAVRLVFQDHNVCRIGTTITASEIEAKWRGK